MTDAVADPRLAEDRPRDLGRQRRTTADRVYRAIGTSAGLLVLVILCLIGIFLLVRSLPAFRLAGLHFFTTSAWEPDAATHQFGIAAVLYWTIVMACMALLIAVPLSVFAAVYLTEFAPRRIRGPLVTLIDLLAAVPSLIFGLWGAYFLMPRMIGTSRWISVHLGWIPIFRVTTPDFASSAFIVAIVLALMVMPIVTSISREVFSQVPVGEKEAALALGGTRWGMVRKVVLPYGRGGIIGASMLGLGRALGETIAIVIIASPLFVIRPNVLQLGTNSVAALIALRFGDASKEYGIPALMAAGLTLFMFTLLVNSVAAFVVNRSRSGKGGEL